MDKAVYRGQRWARVRLAIINRDRWRCTTCGRVTAHPHVHHIHKPRHGGSMFDPGNLRTLCMDCHIEEHHPQRRIDADMRNRLDYIYRGP